ncbi:hypothetical protein H0H87_007666 [Tephrocybe sp. NHM501043]|nr:hypothetical protein H0H87_007666 [Tephrocybe sp. NHM501043]
MAIMTHPISLPDSPSPELDTKDVAPNTPVSPTTPASGPAPASPPAAKRKPSRRANTAERRATHNAVERQRRETLNGRFLDLAALLPNLSQIRRPSKSSIVNSSIAHIHASRRHRMLASRELRLLKMEADALRRELNEWRERAGIPPIEDPIRGDGFSMIIGGELEVIVGVAGGEGDEDDEDAPNNVGYGGYVGGDGVLNDDDFDMEVLRESSAPGASPTIPSSAGGLDDPRMLAMLKSQQSPFAHGLPPSAGLPHILPRPGNASTASGGPTNVPAFDTLYEHYPAAQGLPHAHSQLLQQQHAAYLHQQHAHALREREREREREFREHHHRERELHHLSREREREREIHLNIRERERALVAAQQQQQHHHQEKLWSMYGGAPPPPPPSSRGHSGSFSSQQSWGSSPTQTQQQMMMQAQRSLFTPPATSHGLPTPSPPADAPAGSPASSASGVVEETGNGAPVLRARSGSRSSRGSHSPSYELGPVGMGPEYMGMGEYAGHGVPRMGGLMGMGGVGVEMPLMGVGVEMN